MVTVFTAGGGHPWKVNLSRDRDEAMNPQRVKGRVVWAESDCGGPKVGGASLEREPVQLKQGEQRAENRQRFKAVGCRSGSHSLFKNSYSLRQCMCGYLRLSITAL